MSRARDAVFAALKSALEPLRERAAAPPWEDALLREDPKAEASDLWALFAQNLAAVNGTAIEGFPTLGRWLLERRARVGYCDPTLVDRLIESGAFGAFELRTVLDRARADAYEFGLTRASGAIASTGTVVLKDRETASRLGALAPWIHIAILTPEQLLFDLPAALAQLGDDPSVIWVTGPSKTADVEGILIEGAHGPGVQVVCLDRGASSA